MKKPASALRAARERCGLTIRDVRAVTHIATGRLSMLERDMVKPNAGEREALSAALAESAAALFPEAASPRGPDGARQAQVSGA